MGNADFRRCGGGVCARRLGACPAPRRVGRIAEMARYSIAEAMSKMPELIDKTLARGRSNANSRRRRAGRLAPERRAPRPLGAATLTQLRTQHLSVQLLRGPDPFNVFLQKFIDELVQRRPVGLSVRSQPLEHSGFETDRR